MNPSFLTVGFEVPLIALVSESGRSACRGCGVLLGFIAECQQFNEFSD
jgi:hypothetical protein